jgi:hypothetical protein
VWGAHLRGGGHHHLEEVFLRRGRLLQRQGQKQGKFRGKQEQKQRKGSEKRQSKQEEERLTKARSALLHKACAKVFEKLQGTREWLLLYQVHLYMFPVLYFFL